MENAYLNRFSGIERLYGHSGLNQLRQARVLIVGLGGVGSWTAESLARSGVGHLALMDYDEICISNTNRQLHTLDNTLGQMKIDVLAERLKIINPEISITKIPLRLDLDSVAGVLAEKYSVVVDAIDTLKFKCLLLSECRKLEIPVISVGSSGGRVDPTQIKVGDLYQTGNDPLLQQTRKKLRRHFDFPDNKKKKREIGIKCVYSVEPQRLAEGADVIQGPLDCRTGYGSISFVTGSMGLQAAALVVQSIIAPT